MLRILFMLDALSLLLLYRRLGDEDEDICKRNNALILCRDLALKDCSKVLIELADTNSYRRLAIPTNMCSGE